MQDYFFLLLFNLKLYVHLLWISLLLINIINVKYVLAGMIDIQWADEDHQHITLQDNLKGWNATIIDSRWIFYTLLWWISMVIYTIKFYVTVNIIIWICNINIHPCLQQLVFWGDFIRLHEIYDNKHDFFM